MDDGGSIPVRGREFFSSPPLPGGLQTAANPMGTGGYFPGDKAAGA